MKQIIILGMGLLLSNFAMADGFECTTVNEDLNISVYNHTQPSMGTRNGAIMVISDPDVSLGRKTVAVFTSKEGTLSNNGSKYYANVDERYSNIPKGELLPSTKIDFLKSIIVDIDFSYSAPVQMGSLLDAWVILSREDGTQVKLKAFCERYLKN